MFDLPVEKWIWASILILINVSFIIYNIRILVVSYRVLSSLQSIKSDAISPAQQAMQRLRWLALTTIILRIAWLVIFLCNNGDLASDHTFDTHDAAHSVYMIIYQVLELISVDGKVLIMLIIMQNAASLLIASMDGGKTRRKDMLQLKDRLRSVHRLGVVLIVCLVVEWLVQIAYWVAPQSVPDKDILFVSIYGALLFGFWLVFARFAFQFRWIRSQCTRSYYRASHGMPEYKKLYFRTIRQRLHYAVPFMWVWMILYFAWTLVNITDRVLRTTDSYNNAKEYHVALYYVYWIVCDTLLFVVILLYIRPQVAKGILQKYSRPINVRKKSRVSVEQVY